MNEIVKKGLGGWLIFVGIGVVSLPISFSWKFIETTYDSYFAWSLITTVDSKHYVSGLSYLLIAEIIFLLIFTILSCYMLYSFFQKKKIFPKLFCYFYSSVGIILYIDNRVTEIIVEGYAEYKPGVTWLTWLITCLIWGSYLLMSKRAKATFIN